MKLYAASTNPGKLREFGAETLPGIREIEPPEETGSTFEENAAIKAIYYSRFTDALVLADDSGLEVDALNGAPGVYSARFAGPQATDADNNSLLLEKLRGVADRRGRYVCVIALAQRGELLASFRGECEGEIIDEARGDGGFGYDPYFLFPAFGRTLAEVSAEEKQRVSHRGKALRALHEFLQTQAQKP
jgi:XTP/dITP diphosphohydrolase